MKNIQIIDGAINCSFSIYAVPDQVFQQLYPESQQDIEFLEDVIQRLGEQKAGELMKHTWNSRQQKCQINGIHGTLFIGMQSRKVLYPNKKEADLDDPKIQTKIRGAL
jgi:hypothetical protein